MSKQTPISRSSSIVRKLKRSPRFLLVSYHPFNLANDLMIELPMAIFCIQARVSGDLIIRVAAAQLHLCPQNQNHAASLTGRGVERGGVRIYSWQEA